jgi:hypothetical protein
MDVGGLSVPGYQVFGMPDSIIGNLRGSDFLSFFSPGDRETSKPDAGDARQPLTNNGSSGDFIRYINRFRESTQSIAASYPVKSGNEMQPPTETANLDTLSFVSNRQSSELTIKTRDGDLVTIRIHEKEQAASSLQLANQNGRAGDDSGYTDIETYQQQEAAGSFDFNAIFANGEVSDVSMVMDANSREYTAVNYRSEDGNRLITANYRSLSSTSSHLSFEVKGSLDQKELKAVGDLLNDVDSLADEFFNGDIQAAFSKATQLGYDDSEIAGYALNLIEQETTVVADRYQYTEDQSAMPASVSKPISAYTNRLSRIQETANLYFEMKALEVMMDRIAKVNAEYLYGEKEGVDASERFRDFNERILSAMIEWLA